MPTVTTVTENGQPAGVNLLIPDYDASHYEKLIAEINAKGGVVQNDSGQYQLQYGVLATIAPDEIGKVQAAVLAANGQALATPSMAALAVTADDLAQKVKEVCGGIGKLGPIADHVIEFIKGTQASVEWWGPTLVIEHTAADALKLILNGDLLIILPLVAVAYPPAATICTIIGLIGLGFGVYVASRDKGRGVILKEYMWVAPHVISR